MATEVGSIEIALRARIDKLDADLKKAEAVSKKSGKKIGQNMQGAFKWLGNVRVKIGLVVFAMAQMAAIGGLNRMIHSAIDAADALGKTADKLGISKKALQELQFAANQSGVRVEALNMGLQRFGRRAAEAAQGTGEAKDAIAQLGIELRDKTSGALRTTEALFMDAMHALADIESPLERVRLGFKLFDSEGVALVNMAGNVDGLREEAQKLGIVLDDEVIAKSTETKDILEGLSRVTSSQLAPALADLGGDILIRVAETMSEVATWSNKVYRAFADIGNLGLSNSILALNEQLKATAALEERIAIARANNNKRALPSMNAALKEVKQREKDLQDQVDKLNRERDKIAEELRSEKEGERAKFKTAAERKKAEQDLAKRIEDRRKLAKKAHRDYLMQSDQRIALIKEELEEDRDALLAKEEAHEDYTDAIVELEQSAALKIKKIQDDKANELKDSLDEANKEWSGLFDFMEDGFSDALATMLMTGEISFKALAQSFLREFLQIGTGKLVGQLFDFLGGLGGMSSAELNIPNTGTATPIGSLPVHNTGVATPISSLPIHRANGGPVLVGERGPELFIPGQSGFVATNQNLRKMTGGGGGNVTVTVINNSGEESKTTEKDGPNGTRNIEVMIGQAISKNIQKGGDVDQAIRNSYGVHRVGRHGI